MTIDMHSHWRPAALMDVLRQRTTEPMIEVNKDGIEVFKALRGELPIDQAFDDEDQRLAEMDRVGITTSVLSLLGGFTWVQRLPIAESLPLVRLCNDSLSETCKSHEGRFVAFASLPEGDMEAAAQEFERAMNLPGIVGAQVPGNLFLTLKDAEDARPIMEVASRHRAVVFIHYGPRKGDAWPRVARDVDNSRRRMSTLDMQASLSSNMVTLCLTDFLDPYPDAAMVVHNLGGNIPFEIERMDHRCLLDTPDEELPSARFARSRVYVDCNSFGPRAIEAGLRAYGTDRILFGTDGTEFGGNWSTKAIKDADMDDDTGQKILHGNAAAMLSHLAPIASYRQAAE